MQRRIEWGPELSGVIAQAGTIPWRLRGDLVGGVVWNYKEDR